VIQNSIELIFFSKLANQPLVRGTAVTNFALKANLPVEGLIRATVLILCGGVNEVIVSLL
jgi:proline dehydrogenase